MPDFTKLAEQYIATWNETDPSARRALIGRVWSEGGRYIDPLADVTGPDQIDAVIAGAQAQFSGMTFPARQRRRRAPRPGPVHLGARTGRHRRDRGRVRRGPGGCGRRLALVLGFLDRVPMPAEA